MDQHTRLRYLLYCMRLRYFLHCTTLRYFLHCTTLRYILHQRAAKAKVSLQIYGDLPGPSLLTDAINAEIPFTGPVIAACADPEGGEAGGQDPHPLENRKAIGFLSTTGLDPLENRKATKADFINSSTR